MVIEIARNLIVFVIILGGLIIVHELGHFLACKSFGIAVKEFGIGLPPRLVKLGQWHGTDVTLNWLPVGGFVRPEGEIDAAIVGGLSASSPWKRLVVFVAGPAANVALAFLILTITFLVGWPERVAIDDVMSGSPAEAAGLQVGDLILTANGMPIRYPDALGNIAISNLHKPVKLVVQRNEATLHLTIIPDTSWSANNYPMGVSMHRSVVAYPMHIALVRAGQELANQFEVTAVTLWKMAQGGAAAAPPSEAARVVGVIGLKQISDRAVDNSVKWGQWFPVLQLSAFVSAALGIANLLPLPALDGGRIAFIFVETIRRKRLDPRIERWANITGMVALIVLMVVLMAKDIAEPIF